MQEEEEIHMWFEEKKEELTKGYLKKMDALLVKQEEGKDITKKDMDLIHAKLKEYEKEFIGQSTAIRNKFDSMVLKFRQKQKNKITRKKNLKKAFRWAVIIWKYIKIAYIFTRDHFLLFKKDAGNYLYLNVKAKASRKKEMKKMKRRAKHRNQILFYHQKVWPILHYLNTPNRRFKKWFGKSRLKIKEKIRKGIGKIIALIKKVIGWIVNGLKAIFAGIGFVIAKIKEFISATKNYILKIKEVIKLRFFPEKED